MRITVIGGTGLIGSRLVDVLERGGHQVIAASRATGVNSFTGEGLADALEGTQTVIDVSNSSYTDEAAALEFFETSTLNLLTYGAAAGVAHHVALSVVGTDRLARSHGGYFIAKAVQERLVIDSRRAYSLVHATQFFEFIRDITETALRCGGGSLADVLVQPMAADDVASAVGDIAVGEPVGGIVEFAGPEVFSLADVARRDLRFRHDERELLADPLGTYFGARVGRWDLLPDRGATISATSLHQWQTGVPVPH
ncbi:SDR family oxidoreductase [Microbacterium sp. zg.B48]|uniref:SDR family oxidoreductase n=1 Tax=Microbacterium sp. zg.B48 TaxID=2969408 RepID=UPI00214B3A90|nr:SDR family oxidoreductase [Microbacterium sp. zg.B48]MCR2763783.1 SDR family oxidoreductase [Microbacterium sp. zg.B48]